MSGRHLYIIFASLLATPVSALAFDDAMLGGHEQACSSLCRTWMSLGRAERPARSPAEPAVAPIAQPAAVPVPPPVAGLAPKARTAVAKPKVRVADKPRRSPQILVPSTTTSAAPSVTQPFRLAEAEVPKPAAPVRTAIADRPPSSAEASTLVVVDRPAKVEEPEAPPRAVVAEAVPSPAAPSPPPPARVVGDAPRPAAAGGTPLSVKLAVYALLAALIVWGFRTDRRSDAPDGGAEPSRRRRSIRGREGIAQHAAVDAL